jgi:hypothetical protein
MLTICTAEENGTGAEGRRFDIPTSKEWFPSPGATDHKHSYKTPPVLQMRRFRTFPLRRNDKCPVTIPGTHRVRYARLAQVMSAASQMYRGSGPSVSVSGDGDSAAVPIPACSNRRASSWTAPRRCAASWTAPRRTGSLKCFATTTAEDGDANNCGQT